jgi:hypothetical protein
MNDDFDAKQWEENTVFLPLVSKNSAVSVREKNARRQQQQSQSLSA